MVALLFTMSRSLLHDARDLPSWRTTVPAVENEIAATLLKGRVK